MRGGNTALAPASREISPRDNRASDRGTVREQGYGNIRWDETRVIPFPKARIHEIDTFQLVELFGDAIRRDTANCKSPVKKVAQAINGSIRTGENYTQKKNAPNLLQGLRLAASADFPHVRQLVIELLAIDTRNNALVEQKLNELFAVCHAKQRDAGE